MEFLWGNKPIEWGSIRLQKTVAYIGVGVKSIDWSAGVIQSIYVDFKFS